MYEYIKWNGWTDRQVIGRWLNGWTQRWKTVNPSDGQPDSQTDESFVLFWFHFRVTVQGKSLIGHTQTMRLKRGEDAGRLEGELLMLKEVGSQVGGHSGRRKRKGDSMQIQRPFQVHAGAMSSLSLVAQTTVGNIQCDGQWGSAPFLFPLTHSSLSHIEKGLMWPMLANGMGGNDKRSPSSWSLASPTGPEPDSSGHTLED